MKAYTKKLLISAACLVSISPTAFKGSAYAQTAPAPPPAGGTFDQRLMQRKQERRISLDDKAQKRLANLCVNAQGVIRKLQQESRPINVRTDTYQKIDAKLWIAIGKLKMAQKDTFKLEGQRAKFGRKGRRFPDHLYLLQTGYRRYSSN